MTDGAGTSGGPRSGGSGTVTVGTATAAPGTAVRGVIPVTELAGGTPLEIPVVVVNGASDGPCFWVNGAIHGDEPEGPLACQIALAEVDPAELAGALVLCPVLNVPAFNAAERGNPGDTFTYDMNRIYPGRPCERATRGSGEVCAPPSPTERFSR